MTMSAWRTLALIGVWLRVSVLSLSVSAAADSRSRLWSSGDTLLYSAESVVQLNEAARQDKDVGWRITADVAVRAAACGTAPHGGGGGGHHDVLLHFQVVSPRLELRGAAADAEWNARPSLWDAPALQRSDMYAHWRDGVLLAAYMPRGEDDAVRDYRRALLSPFQSGQWDTDRNRNETDASGDCYVAYEPLEEPLHYRKLKLQCRWGGASPAADAGVESRRVTRYELTADGRAIRLVHAEEQHVLTADAAPAAVKTRGWTRLLLQTVTTATASTCPPPPDSAHDVLSALPQDAALEAVPLPLHVPDASSASLWSDPDDSDADYEADADAALEQLERLERVVQRAAWLSEHSAAQAARAAAPAVRAVRAAGPRRVAAVLQRANHTQLLVGVARVLGYSGVAAPPGLLDSADAALEYLRALRREAGGGAAVHAVLHAAATSRHARVRVGAWLSAAAAAAAHPQQSQLVRDHLTKRLANCAVSDVECRVTSLLALGNLRRADCLDLLLRYAAGADADGEHADGTHADGAIAMAALRALELLYDVNGTLPLHAAHALLQVVRSERRALEVRGAALQLAAAALRRAPHALTHTARVLAAQGAHHAHELRRVLLDSLRALAEHEAEDAPQLAAYLRALHADPELGSWAARALHGTSHVAGARAGRWGATRARLTSVQLAARGVLRRGRVALHVARRPALAVELAARGLAALTGGAADADEPLEADLYVAVGGVLYPPIRLFSSQSELLGHIWSGAGSSPADVVRAVLPVVGAPVLLPLPAGAPVLLRADAAAAVRVTAHGAVSLWSRTARATLAVRAAAAATVRAVLPTPWGRAAVTSRADLTSAGLRVTADVDAYDEMALCVRATLDPQRSAAAHYLRSELGARRRRIVRRRRAAAVAPPASLALPAPVQRACAQLRPEDDADDDDDDDAS